MKAYLLRMTILLITFATGVGTVLTGRYVQSGGVERADTSNQKPFVLVIRKRADNARPRNNCY